MLEIYVIYDKDSGFYYESGRIDRERDLDYLEALNRKAVEYPKGAIIFLPDQNLPESERHKVKNGKIVELTKKDKVAIEAARPKSEIELLKERITLLEKN